LGEGDEEQRAILTRAAHLVIGTHYAAPTADHIRRDGAAFRFETCRPADLCGAMAGLWMLTSRVADTGVDPIPRMVWGLTV